MGVLGHAQVPDSKATPSDAANAENFWRDWLQQEAAKYKPSIATDPPTPLSASPIPVLRWANIPRTTEDGTLFIWTAQGRPEVALCIFIKEKHGPGIHYGTEFQSLSRQGLVVKRDGRRFWYPTTPGVEFRSVPDAPAPAETAKRRLSQMKMLARRFSGTAEGAGSLRLLPQPVYRYESKAPDLLDGALFAFVFGTDPELLLLLEAVPVHDRHEWQYAFARMYTGPLEARYGGKTVWRIPVAPKGASHPYYIFWRPFTTPRPE